jgi:lipopolysaccharide/colanic/teichoic acid biosynthesis glycosyltransferase
MLESEPAAASPATTDQPARREQAKPIAVGSALSGCAMPRAADLAVAAALITFTLPLMAFVCLAIKLDSPGPVLFRQPRLRTDGRRFQLHRFRTTVHESNRLSKPLWDRRAQQTRVGAFLRYTRIEDLPQLVNVLRGELRLLGTGLDHPIFAD